MNTSLVSEISPLNPARLSRGTLTEEVKSRPEGFVGFCIALEVENSDPC